MYMTSLDWSVAEHPTSDGYSERWGAGHYREGLENESMIRLRCARYHVPVVCASPLCFARAAAQSGFFL